MNEDGALSDLTVVELGEMVAAPYAAKLLADFGARVVKVERPGGDPARRRGPFPDGVPHPDRSGLFLYVNTNKRGITLDIAQASGRAVLDALLDRADIFVTNLPVADLEALDLRPATVRAAHPRLIVTTITPFGIGGPYGGYVADELVAYAMGGLAYSSPGLPDEAADAELEPPLHPTGFIAETVTGVVAAGATMLQVVGAPSQGAHVDISEQAAVISMDRRSVAAFSYGGIAASRLPTTIGQMPNCYLPCKDGYVVMAAFLDHHWERLVDAIGRPDWAVSDLFRTSAARGANWDALRLLLLDWTMQHTGDEIWQLGRRAGLPLFPFFPVRRVVEHEHLAARGSLVAMETDGRPFHMPGPPLHMHGTPWMLRHPAPARGQHTAEILDELGYDGDALRQLFAAGVV